MIKVIKGDALDAQTGFIVHGCNCHGVMGAGIALGVKNRFPEAYKVYRQTYEKSGLKLGEICYAEVDTDKIIVNANTQDGFGRGIRQVSYDAIVECFEKVVALSEDPSSPYYRKYLNIVFPMIGAGLGGGKWDIISNLIDNTVPDHFNKILYKLI